MKPLQQRLDQILEKIESEAFLSSKGLGNEIAFWVFDYPARQEIQVREHLQFLTDKLNHRGYRFSHLNLFAVVIEMLQERTLLDRAIELEKQQGMRALKKALKAPLDQVRVAEFITRKIEPQQQQFVLLSGLGSAWPWIRGHSLLNALHPKMGATPLVLFYPGEYSGLDLKTFGIIESKNYYRAFKLVPDRDR